MSSRSKKDSLKRTSIFSSSAESMTSFEDSYIETLTTQDELYENIRLHKEIIQSVKGQPLSLSKKYKIVTKAKQYVAHHEGTLQERFAKSGNTKDLLARIKIMMADRLKHLKREIWNYLALLIPWEIRIKEIESRFGSVVASYFIFLRWLFWVNTIICKVFLIFVILPEYFSTDSLTIDERKVMLPEEKNKAMNFITIWDFEGFLRYSPLFYGYYSNKSGAVRFGYQLPIAYFLAGLFVYVYSFVATLRKMAENSRSAKLSSKDDECVFSWKLFTGWDFMIGHSETAQNRIASVVLGFKEALLEEAEKQKDKKNWKIILCRIFVNINVLFLLIVSAYAVVDVVERSDDANDNWWSRNEITFVMSFISYVFPMLFEILGFLEYYHPRIQLRLQLARIMILNLLNLYSLIWALFGKISRMTAELATYKDGVLNETSTTLMSYPAYSTTDMMSDPQFSTTPSWTSNITNMSLGVTIITILTSSITDVPTINTTHLPSYTTSTPTELFDTTEPYSENYFVDNISTTNFDYNSNSFPFEQTTEHYDYSNYDYFEKNENLYPQYQDANIQNNLENDTSDSTDIELTSEVNFLNFSSMDEKLENFTDEIIFFTEDSLAMNETSPSTIISTLSSSSSLPFSFDNFTDYADIALNENSTQENVIYDIQHDPPPNAFFKETISVQTANSHDPMIRRKNLTSSELLKLRRLCWETMFGQELVKLTVMDLILTVISVLFIDFFRALFVRYMNGCWCWDLEKRFPKYGDFKIAENILHLVNNQGMVWMGMFFSPGLAILNLIKLVIILYLRSWAVLTCNVPHEVVFRASRSNNFYLTLLLTMLFLCVLPVSYAIVWLKPSWHCGPFSDNERIYHLFTETIKNILPQSVHKFLDYIASPAAIIPLLLLLVLFIYYLMSLTGALREANLDLKDQLHKERTEERKKMMKLMEDKMLDAQYSSKLSDRWKKVLTASQPGAALSTVDVLAEESAERKKLLLAKAMNNILRKKYSHHEVSSTSKPAVKAETEAGPDPEPSVNKKKLVLARAMKNILKKKQEKNLNQQQDAVKEKSDEKIEFSKIEIKIEEETKEIPEEKIAKPNESTGADIDVGELKKPEDSEQK